MCKDSDMDGTDTDQGKDPNKDCKDGIGTDKGTTALNDVPDQDQAQSGKDEQESVQPAKENWLNMIDFINQLSQQVWVSFLISILAFFYHFYFIPFLFT